MKRPSEERIAELVGMTMMVKSIVEHLASTPGIALSVYYTLFVGEIVEIAACEGNFELIMDQLRRDRDRWDQMLKAKNANELYEIAKFTADFITNEPDTPAH